VERLLPQKVEPRGLGPSLSSRILSRIIMIRKNLIQIAVIILLLFNMYLNGFNWIIVVVILAMLALLEWSK